MAEEFQVSASPKVRMIFKGNKEFIHKPIIREILRTDNCVPGSIMLVEKVENIEASALNPSAIRLLLGDGELCIQAFISPSMRALVEGGKIMMGCYVRLDDFSIERIDIERGEDTARSKKRKRRLRVVFLRVEKLETVGWDLAYMKHARPALHMEPPSSISQSWQTPEFNEDNGITEIEYTPTKSTRKRSLSGSEAVEDADLQTASSEQLRHQDSDAPQKLDGTNNREVSHLKEEIRQEGYQDDTLDQCEESTTQRRIIHKPDEFSELNVSSQKLNHLPMAANPRLQALKEAKKIPMPLSNRTSLLPRTLASLSQLPSRQNSPCTVFAIIDEIAPIKSCPIPPHKTREVRLVDPSTSKRVLLSILWRPENFTLQVGTPVLLRGLKNHKYDGGSLNAYPKSVSLFAQKEDGEDWWIPFPRGWYGCDVDGYLEWWERRKKGMHQS